MYFNLNHALEIQGTEYEGWLVDEYLGSDDTDGTVTFLGRPIYPSGYGDQRKATIRRKDATPNA